MATQRDKLKALFKLYPRRKIPLTEILILGIAQYNARIFELRHYEGMDIQNDWDMRDGVKCSWYQYIPAEKQLEMEI